MLLQRITYSELYVQYLSCYTLPQMVYYLFWINSMQDGLYLPGRCVISAAEMFVWADSGMLLFLLILPTYN